jgi:hypothetical protein
MRSVWYKLTKLYEDADPVALASLLKVMVVHGDAPPDFVAKLSQALAEITAWGRYFRAQRASLL